MSIIQYILLYIIKVTGNINDDKHVHSKYSGMQN